MSLAERPSESYANGCLSKSYPAVAESLPHARAAITEFASAAGLIGERLEAVRLAASEALTNVVVHAYRHGSGRMHVTAAVAGDELWVLVSDDGSGMHARTDSPGLGCGLALIAQICDSMEIVSRGIGGTELRMQFSLDAADAGWDGQSRGRFASAISPARSSFSTTT
jgi:anti-sigma regulatory factor (Ser/Thr protein kinase)